MSRPTAKRRLLISCVLVACGLAVCGWQAEEHVRFRHSAEQALINRGRDITATLGVLMRSQRRFGRVSKERLESQLEAMIGPKELPKELEGVAVLAATGEPIASAGSRIELPPDVLQSKGVFWGDRTLTIMNLMDLGATAAATGDESARPRPPPTIVADERTRTALNAANRRPAEARPEAAAPATAAPETSDSPPAQNARPLFGQPAWMTREEFNSILQKQGAHSLVLSLSIVEMRRLVNADLWLRVLVSFLAMGGAIGSIIVLRNASRNAELQIRLVKAGEMNTHLKEMNLAAAGLAHETRNPLNLIRGFAQMITIEAREAPKLKEHAAAIIEETDRVTGQLNEFINYSKPREAQIGPVHVSRLVGDVARTLVPDLEEKHIQLNQADSPLRVEADEQLLRQALFNVLLNATQAVGPGGRIDVRIAANGQREAVLEIADDGPGVPADQRTSIFKPYVTMRPKGVGLGLAIVAQIAAAHRWEVTCLANEPRGALFRFSHLKVAAPAT